MDCETVIFLVENLLSQILGVS